MAICCPVSFTGFCLVDGTPIAIVIENGIQLGWINIVTSVFTPGAPPAGTHSCSNSLTCETDSVTICPPASGITFEVEVVGTVQVTESFLNEANVTIVPANTVTTTLLVANPTRKRAIFFNDSASTSYVKFGAGAAVNDYSIQLPTREYYELTFPYTGIVTAIWGTTDGDMHITEFE